MLSFGRGVQALVDSSKISQGPGTTQLMQPALLARVHVLVYYEDDNYNNIPHLHNNIIKHGLIIII